MADGQAVLEPLEGFDDDSQEGAEGKQTQTGTEGQGTTQTEGQQDGQQTQGQTQSEEEGPYSAKTSKEFSNALKAWKDANPDNLKWARMAKDDHARLYQLHQVEPEGLEGVRAKYALLDSITHGDTKGMDAVTAMQDALQSYGDVDSLIAAGDPKALDELGDDFNEGIAKLVPSILDRVAASNPEAYAAAVLPHFVEALKQSDLVRGFNALVDTLEEKPPAWLPADKKEAWLADHMQRVIGHASTMGNWLNAQAKKAGESGARTATGTTQGTQRTGTQSTLDQREQAIVQREQSEYWGKSIEPETNKVAEQTFKELLKPYEKRLKLDDASMKALGRDFVQGVSAKALAKKADGSPSDFAKQMQRYHAQRNPNAQAVSNYFGVEFRKHASTVFKSLITERYGAFLNGKPSGQVQNQVQKPAGSANPGAAKQMQYVSVKPDPSTFDNTKRSLNDIYSDIYRLNDGRVVKYKRAS